MDDLDALLAAQASARQSASQPSQGALDQLLADRASPPQQLPQGPNAALQGGRLSFGPFTTPIPTSPAVDQFLSGIGSGLTSFGQGIKERLGRASPQDVVAKRQADAQLLNTTGGWFGNIVGQSAPALATLPIPGANTIGGAALAGGLLGAAQPTGPGESVGANAALGAGGGIVGQGAANLVGRLIAPVRPSLSAEDQRLATFLMNNGVNLDLAQQTGSKPLRIINSILDNLPGSSGMEEAKRAAQSRALNRGVMATAGESADNAAPEVMSGALSRLGGNFNDIYNRNSVSVDDPLLHSITETLQKSDSAVPIVAKADKILSSGPDIPGRKYQDIRTQLRTLQGSQDPEVSSGARSLKYSLDDAARRSISPDDAALLDQTRQQYANLMTISKAMKSSNAVGGDIPPAQLRMAVANSDPRAYVTGNGDLNDWARAGARFLNNPTPNSGTAQRMFYQGLLTGAAAGGGTFYETGDLRKSLGATAAGLLGPVVAQKALSGTGLLGRPIGAYIASGPGRTITAEEIRRLLSPALAGAGAVALRPQ